MATYEYIHTHFYITTKHHPIVKFTRYYNYEWVPLYVNMKRNARTKLLSYHTYSHPLNSQTQSPPPPVVYDFGVKYTNASDVHDLIQLLQYTYIVTTYFT